MLVMVRISEAPLSTVPCQGATPYLSTPYLSTDIFQKMTRGILDV